MIIVKILVIWSVISIPVSLFAAKFIAWGTGSDLGDQTNTNAEKIPVKSIAA